MNIISSSYGNDSIALIQLAKTIGLENVIVVYCDTKWAHNSWEERISIGESLAYSYGFETTRIKGDLSFCEMVLMKKAFPYHGAQFCTGILKGIPFLDFCEKIDPDGKAVVITGKRRAESFARATLEEFDPKSAYHGGRKLWNPLYEHSDYDRDKLVIKSNIKILPHRSLECCPCVNAGKRDLLMIEPARLEEIRLLEKKIGHPMYRAAKHGGANGIDEIMKWAVSPRGAYGNGQLSLFDEFHGTPCALGLCG